MVYEIINEKVNSNKTTSKYIDTNDGDIIIPTQENSDVAQTIKELNDDTQDTISNFSNIDMKTRLHPIEISSIIALDSLVALKLLPIEASFITRSKKRLAVSQMGLGREEIVRISQGMQESQSGSTGWEKLGKMFGGGK